MLPFRKRRSIFTPNYAASFITLPEALPPGVTFTRASSATYRNSAGLMVTAATDVLRYEYNANNVVLGALIEDAKTNSITFSEAIDNAAWTKVQVNAISADAGVGPEGLTNLDLVTENTAAAEHYVQQSVAVNSGERWTFSFFVRQAVGSRACVVRIATAATASVSFDLSTGNATNIATTDLVVARSESWGGGLWRLSITVTASSTANLVCRAQLAQGTTVSYTGDGASGWYLGYVQVELGDFPSSYIPTTTVAVTRAKDSLVMTPLTRLAFNEVEGTVLANVIIPYNQVGGARQTVLQVDDNTNNNRHVIGNDANTSTVQARTQVAGASQCTLTSAAFTFGTAFKYAFAFAANNYGGCLNGGTVQTDAAGSMPTGLTHMRIGQQQAMQALNGYIREVRYWNHRLPDYILQELTA